MKIRTFLYLLNGLLISAYPLHAGLIYSNGSGNWTNASTWLNNGAPALPTCGDTVIIRAGDVVTQNAHLDYTACSFLDIIVDGTFQFTNGNKLDLPCGSFVFIRPGGLLKKATAGGGNSTFIDICGVTFWNASMGPFSGPVYLPVSLLYFDAKAVNDAVDLSWATASETNNDYFLIQRSKDNSTYVNVATINGASTSNDLRVYSAKDLSPLRGISYYRLCQFDFNGDKYCYPPIAVSLNGKGIIAIYNNPTSVDAISFIYDGANATNSSITITDLNGKTVFTTINFLLQTGENKLSLSDRNRFTSGIYFVTIEMGYQIFQMKLIINS